MRDWHTRHEQETEQVMCRICFARGNKAYITAINEIYAIKILD